MGQETELAQSPIEPDPNEQPSDTATATLSEPTGVDASIAEELRDMRVRHSGMGRELKGAKDLLSQQSQQITFLTNQLMRLGASLSQQENDALEAKLSELPADQQALERVKILQQQLNRRQPQEQVQQPVVTQDDVEQEKRSIIAAVNKQFGVEIDPNDDDLDDSSREAYLASLRVKVRQVMRDKEKAVAAGKPKSQAQSTDSDAIRKQVKEEVLAELGVGRSNSPRPAASGKPTGSREAIENIGKSYDPRKGPKAKIAALRAMEVGED